METKTDASFGIIPLQYAEGEWFVFLVEQYNEQRGDSYWTFPKGHAEPGETIEVTALRELAEETALRPVKLLTQPQFTMRYTFIHDGVRIEKTVVYLLGLITNPDYRIQASELRTAGWFPLSAAPEQLSFPNSRTLCTEITTFIGVRDVVTIFGE